MIMKYGNIKSMKKHGKKLSISFAIVMIQKMNILLK